MYFTFKSFVDGTFDYDKTTSRHTCLCLREEKMDIGGGNISIADIDKFTDCDTDTVTISGLNQSTFEYFIEKYGSRLRAIRFFKNKKVTDLSLLGTLPQLEYVHFFANQGVDKLWDMSQNLSLTGLCIEDFSKLHTIQGIEKAPVLRDFSIGNAIWSKMEIESFSPLSNTKIENLSFSGKAILDDDYSFLSSMPFLSSFDFSTNFLTTEQVAWIVSNSPNLKGFSLAAKHDCMLFDKKEYAKSQKFVNVPSTIIVGKRKPSLNIKGNEEKIEKYISAFEKLKEKYKGLTYKEAFPKNS